MIVFSQESAKLLPESKLHDVCLFSGLTVALYRGWVGTRASYSQAFVGVGWCGMVWDCVEWFEMVWNGVGWCGMVWNGVGWCGMVWDGVGLCGMVWNGVEWCGMAP